MKKKIDYLISFQWDGRTRSRFMPLDRRLKNAVLGVVTASALGLACLGGELALWLRREASLRYQREHHASLTEKLARIQEQQRELGSSLDSLSVLEEKIRAVYGMNEYDKAVLGFGVGGRRPAPEPGIPYGLPVFEKVSQSSLENDRLHSKMGFTLSGFGQIGEFVKYRRNLWEHTPFVLPAKGQATSGFGYRNNPVTGEFALHAGLDISNEKWTPVFASASGIVSSSQEDGDFGNLVVIDHGNGYVSKYGHLAKRMVEKGLLVKRFDRIGYMGNTGRATGTHLHYEVHRDGIPQDPEKHILPAGTLVD